jgi:hypothetical protein
MPSSPSWPKLEAVDSTWSNPTEFSFFSALMILNAAYDPVYLNTGYWIQPEDLDAIPTMFESYLNVNCLYYSLVGVLAIKTSLFLENPPEDSSITEKWMIIVARFFWAANGLWGLAAVVTSFHILWAVHATPKWARRKIFDNSRALSIVYALGAPNFAFLLIGTISGVMGHVLAQPNNEYDV